MIAPTATFDRAAWLEERRSGIGASDVGAILGFSPFASAWSVWADKLGLVTSDVDNEDTEFGRRIEPVLATWFEDRTGLRIGSEQRLVRHPKHPWMIATLDAEAFEGPPDETSPLGTVEFKATRDAAWDEIPPAYECQVQWQLAVTGHERAWMGVLHGRRFEVYELERDQAVIDRLVDVCGNFWHEHVLAGNPPEVDGHRATTRTLAEVWPGSGGETDLSHLAVTFTELHRARALLKDLEALIAELENTIKAALGDATVALVDGRVAATWKPSTRTTVDVEAIAAAYPRAVKKFERTTTVRRFLVKPPKE